MTILRTARVTPGYLCPFFCDSKCAEKATRLGVTNLGGGDHGNHGNEWFFELRKPGEGGMHFQIFTPERPDRVPVEKWPDFRLGGSDGGFMDVMLVYHCPWVLSREGILEPRSVGDCALAEPCRTTVEVGRVTRERLWALLDRRTRLEQSEEFWLTYEAIFEAEISDAKVARADSGDLAIRKCDKCNGQGTIPL